MADINKSTADIIEKLGIPFLNAMQEEALIKFPKNDDILLISPTGTGKTLGFLLPLLSMLKPEREGVQLLIIAPSRELAIQIEQVVRSMGTGFKANVVYGGRPIRKDLDDLKTTPSILIGTPGRIADHIRRETFSAKMVDYLVLDEFDKSLEIGFDDDMIEIIDSLPYLKKKILTSATENIRVPEFVDLVNPIRLDFSNLEGDKLELHYVDSPDKDKLEILQNTLNYLGSKPGIVFCNFKDSIARISEYLEENDIAHGIFHGGLEQVDRERALIKFRNGTHHLLLATDLAARGIDVPEIEFIIHYHMPTTSSEFIHRNGRTARMNREGKAIILKWIEEELPSFASDASFLDIAEQSIRTPSEWKTIFIGGGRKDKISKGDIAGLLIKQAGLLPKDLGLIELKQDCAYAGVWTKHIGKIIDKINNTKLKKRKIRVFEI